MIEAVTYQPENIIKLRKIRDSIGVFLTNPKFNGAEQELLCSTMTAITDLPGVAAACSREERGHANDLCHFDDWNALT